MTKRLQLPEANEGYGYVGVWWDGKLGWLLPDNLCGGQANIEPPADAAESRVAMYPQGSRFFLCRIKVEAVTDSKGRPMTRIVRRKT